MKLLYGLLVVAGAAFAQNCSLHPDRIPIFQRHPTITGQISPRVMSNEGLLNFTVQLDVGAGVLFDNINLSPVINVDWRWDSFSLPGTAPGGGPRYDWQVSQSATTRTWQLSYPVTVDAQGTYRLRHQLLYCFKACLTCSVQEAILPLDVMGAVFIPTPDASLNRLLWLLDEESKRSGDSLEIHVVSTSLHSNLKSLLELIARGEFYNCRLGICEKRSPARIQRVLTDKADALKALAATGCLMGGIIPGCQGRQDSRVYDIGPKLQDFGILIASGGKRDYIAFGAGLITGGSLFLFEGPKGAGGMLKEALLLAFMQQQGREVR